MEITLSQRSAIHSLARAVIIDQNHLLVCKTLDLPTPFYFLPGGHIEHGESAEHTLIRELREEAGAAVTIKRFLGVFEHFFEPGHNSICHNHEYNFIFEAESPELKMGKSIPQPEKHIKLLWIPLEELDNIDFRPKPLCDILRKWLNNTAEILQSNMS